MSIQVERITDSEWKTIGPKWDGLVTRSSSNHPFLLWDWLDCWRTHLGSDKECWFLSIREGERWVGAVPFYLARDKGVRVLRFCSENDLYSDYMDAIAEIGHEEKVAEELIIYLKGKSACWDLISFGSLLNDSVLMRSSDRFKKHFAVRTEESNCCPFINTENAYEKYMSSQFNRKKRYNLERQIKILMGTNGCVLRKALDRHAVSNDIEKLFKIHSQRAEIKEIESSFSKDLILRFHQDWACRALKKGMLDLNFIEKEGIPISAVYAFRYADKIYFYQSGMDPEWQKLSAGTVLLTLLIQSAFSDGLKEFDFLKGNEKYKHSWMTGERKEYKLEIFNRTAAGRAAYGWALVKKFLKNRFRSGKEREHVSAL